MQTFQPFEERHMGLLDSILGAALNQGGGQNQGGGLGGVLGSMLGGGGQGGGQAALLNIVLGMLANRGGGSETGLGGLSDLLGKFQQGGLGDVASSWVGKGENLPISADQLQSVLGSDMVASIAAQLGMSQGDTASQLSQLLPEVVDRVTPDGQVPDGGLGDIGSLLTQFTQR
jgi:uncharacterized protein YidB (DUF937 family)